MPDLPAILPGAEPYSAAGGADGVLVVHGFTGSPQSLRPLAEAFAAAGYTVELPRLPGHGTSAADLATTSWDDWSGAAEAAFEELAARCDRVVVAGLSMGGTITAWLAARHPEISAIVLVNPAIEPPADSFLEIVQTMLDQGHEMIPAIGSDIAKEGVEELAADETPVVPLQSLFAAQAELTNKLGDIRCPAIVFTSTQDHVVPPSSSDWFAERTGGPVERVTLERSYHVATLDHDAPLIFERSVEFVQRILAG